MSANGGPGFASIVAVTHHAIARINIVAVLIASTAALVGRSWLQVSLQDGGLDGQYAADVSYLIVPPILLLLLFPVIRSNRAEIRQQFPVAGLNTRMVLYAIALGVLLRLAWWCQLVAGVSFGVYRGDGSGTINGPLFEFQCPPGHEIALGFLVMAILVPIIEEVIHRGFIQSALYRYGPWAAIAGSAVVFTIFHPPGNWGFVFLAGVVFGTQYWLTKSLWSSLTTHTTINGLVQLDWRCVQGQWTPPASDLPMVAPGVLALVFSAVSIATIVAILRAMHRGETSPR